MRCVALLRIDKFAPLERVVGATASEVVLIEVGRLLKETLHPKELAGRFGGTRFLVLLERGNEHDISAWSERLVARVQKHVMRVSDKSRVRHLHHRTVGGDRRARSTSMRSSAMRRSARARARPAAATRA